MHLQHSITRFSHNHIHPFSSHPPYLIFPADDRGRGVVNASVVRPTLTSADPTTRVRLSVGPLIFPLGPLPAN